LGHVAKSFALREKPKELAGKEGAGDIIGRIFNGEFATKERLAQLKRDSADREKLATERKLLKTLQQERKLIAKNQDTEAFSDEEDEGFGDESNGGAQDSDDSEIKVDFEKVDCVVEAKLTGDIAPCMDDAINHNDEKFHENKIVASNGRTWSNNRAESVLGKRKLSFGKQRLKPAVSGKFRKSGGYFRKKLRTQSASEFSQ
jgi:hypothetical protein